MGNIGLIDPVPRKSKAHRRHGPYQAEHNSQPDALTRPFVACHYIAIINVRQTSKEILAYLSDAL